MMESLQGKVAFVSGASRGIGAACAERFFEAGMRLVLCSRSAPVLPESDQVISRQLDVRSQEGMEALAQEAESRFGAIDLWVNNAGMLEPIRPVRDVSVEDFRNHIDTNLTGVFIGSQCYVQHLRRVGRGGVLINLSSGAAWKAYSGWGAYCAGKAGVERLTEVIQVEEESIGLRAHSVAPGVVDTAMQVLIRNSPAEDFPDLDRFVQMKRDEDFNDADFVAREFLAIAFDPERRPDSVAHRIEYGDGEAA